MRSLYSFSISLHISKRIFSALFGSPPPIDSDKAAAARPVRKCPYIPKSIVLLV
jgi:hypothetical protein